MLRTNDYSNVDVGTPERNMLTRRKTWGHNDPLVVVDNASDDDDDVRSIARAGIIEN